MNLKTMTPWLCQKYRLSRRQFSAFLMHGSFAGIVTVFRYYFPVKEFAVARIGYPHIGQHLSDYYFDMFIVDRHTLQSVHLLYFVDEMFLNFLGPLTFRMSCGFIARPTEAHPHPHGHPHIQQGGGPLGSYILLPFLFLHLSLQP